MTTRLAPPGKLAPPSKAVLPLPGKLSPPVSNAGESFAALPEDMAALAGRTASFVKVASNRASKLAAQHGPTVKQAALNFSTSAAVYAKQAAQGAAEAAKSTQIKLSDPEYREQKSKRLWKVGSIAAGVIIVIGGSSWLYATHQATIIAKNQIDNFIDSSGLASYLTYRSVSASPFGSATLYGVSLSDGNDINITVGAVGISSITKSGGQVTGAKISFKGFSIPALKIMRADFSSQSFTYALNAPALLMDFVNLGYTEITGSATFSVHPSGENSYHLESSGSIDDAGRWSISTDLGNVPSNLVASIQQISTNASATTLSSALPALQSLTNINLIGAKLTINDKQFQDRNGSLTWRASPSDTQDRAFLPIDGDAMVQNGMSTDTAKQIIKTLTNWENNGGTLTVSTNLAQPLPLLATEADSDNSYMGTLDSGFGIPQPTITSVEDFLVKTNAQISF